MTDKVDREPATVAPCAASAALVADVAAWPRLAHELGSGTLAAMREGTPLWNRAAMVNAAIEQITSQGAGDGTFFRVRREQR